MQRVKIRAFPRTIVAGNVMVGDRKKCAKSVCCYVKIHSGQLVRAENPLTEACRVGAMAHDLAGR